MMANDTIMNIQDNSYDSLLENAQRTVFLKELFSQVNFIFNVEKKINWLFLALSRSIGYYEYYSTDGYEKFNSLLGLWIFIVYRKKLEKNLKFRVRNFLSIESYVKK
jgi:hypothetical protein